VGLRVDPIEELARIVGEAQERDAKDERRFEVSALGGRRKQSPPEDEDRKQIAPKPREDL
jgi:hypothetical protein